MAKFLHIADIHLGFDRYDSPERTKDFFLALYDVLNRYALEEQVDFVLIAGDLFEHRNIQPATLNQAQICLQQLKEAGIPVLAIEGNHDNRPYGTRTSWLKYLSEWGLLKLLEPGNRAAGEPFYTHWNEDSRIGGYIDLSCGVRILGSNWYGAAAPRAIEPAASAIATLPSGPEHQILMFHHGLEGQIARYSGAIRYSDLLPLKDAGINYLALGHIHKNYSMENWVFNPGSLEANNIEESVYERGAYLVEITSEGVQATLKTDYCQRPNIRLKLALRGQESQEALVEAAMGVIEDAIAQETLNPEAAPIVELRIEGQVGFNRLDLDIRQLQAMLQQRSGALIFLLKYEVEEVAYSSPVSELTNRLQIEETIFTDLLAAHRDYKRRSTDLAKALMDLKERQLTGASELELYQFVQAVLTGDPPEE
ncbi:MAG TPA: DNA repair exonuclease [Leptolyngbyaceae cyanobacterium]